MINAVFLDRDGVINAAVVRDGKPYPPTSADDMVVLPGVAVALKLLKQLGYLTIVVTNQPDIARGHTSALEVDAINQALIAQLEIDAFMVCPHDDGENCHCRKPKAGMLLDAAREWNIDLSGSFMVGDRWRDIECGQNAGVRTFFIDYGYQERQPLGYDWRIGSLLEAAQFISRLDTSP